MSLSVVLRRLAQAEFDDAADWYEQRRSGRGAAFTAAVRRVLLEIASAPNAHPEVYRDVREALVPGYPYAIYYRAAPGPASVLAIFHTSRDPAEWQSRT